MPCPDIAELEQYVMRDMDDAALAAIRSHVDSCAQCAGDVREMSENLQLAPALRMDRARRHEEPSDTPAAVGPYRVLRKIGQGGMGAVYEAEQENPRRKVALKMIRPGLVSPNVLRRFRREAQILGRLRHPGIAQIFEAGAHLEGNHRQPYFAMELVQGQTLLAYARDNALDTWARLELMAKICDAVQHAHQRGVIHRDLKPDNILVDDSAGAPQPKILDFGVSRVVDPDMKTTTLHTSVGQIVGTVAYMSPEQAGADPADVDTRADVYALGVVCYELLCGLLPYRLSTASVAESVRAIVQDDPTPLATVDRTLRGDVSTIVGKALEKEKSRRYASAAEMADDIRRYLRHEPITAHRPSTVYQLRKFARRNRGLVAGVVLAFVLLIVGVIGTSVGMVRANRAAKVALAEANKQAAINAFMQEMLGAANPRNLTAADRAKGLNVSVVDAMQVAVRRLDEGSLKDQPEIEAAVRNTIATTYMALMEPAKATAQFTRSLELMRQMEGSEGPGIANTTLALAECARMENRLEDAENQARAAIDMAQRQIEPNSNAMASMHNTLGLILQDRGKLKEAEPHFRRALDIRRSRFGVEHRDTATSMNNLAMLLAQEGPSAEAETLYRGCLEVRTKLFGDEHPDSATVLNNLAFLLRDRGKDVEAEPMFRKSLAIRIKLFGDDSMTAANGYNNLGSVLQALGRFDEAEPNYRRAIEIQRKAHGDAHPALAASVNNLASLLRDQGKLVECEVLFRKSLEMRRKVSGDQHVSVAHAKTNLSAILKHLNRLDEAEAMSTDAVSIYTKSFGPTHPQTAAGIANLAIIVQARGRPADAERLAREALNVRLAQNPVVATDEAASRGALGSILIDLERYDEAERELKAAWTVFEPRLAKRDRRAAECAAALARLYERTDRAELARAVRAAVPTTQPATQPAAAARG